MEQQIDAVRQFSRTYTRRLGLLQDGLLGGPLKLTEARVVYEIAQLPAATAAAIAATLELDPAYLSRILRNFEERGWIARRPSATDRRQAEIALTASGRALFEAIDAQSQAHLQTLLGTFAAGERQRLVGALTAAERLLAPSPKPAPKQPSEPMPVRLRPHRIGDLGWIVHRQAILYAEEYGWDSSYEGLVATIVGHFAQHFDPGRERCWIAERDGAILGSIFLVRTSEDVAKLRLLYVEPAARGLGVGGQLVAACIEAAQALGYRRLTLWTNDCLHAALRLYQRAGFVLTEEKRHHSFGHDLVGQTWDLDLTRG